MCTIMTITKDKYDNEAATQILDDSIYGNNDGWSLLLVDEKGKAIVQVRTMDLSAIYTMLDGIDWYRMFLHARLATGYSAVKLANTHGFYSNGVYYMHNGFIGGYAAMQRDVDSMQIGKWLGVDTNFALDRLLDETYANVFLIDVEDGVYWMSRSRIGSLYTDGNGNYSTNPFGEIRDEVPMYSQQYHDLADYSGAQTHLEYQEDDEEDEQGEVKPIKKAVGE